MPTQTFDNLFDFHPESFSCECADSVFCCPASRLSISSLHQVVRQIAGASDALHRHRQTQNITRNNISQKMKHYHHIFPETRRI